MAKPSDEQYHGEPIPYNPDFNGPLRKRSCTDVLCLAIFLLFIGAWIGLGIYAISNGNPSTLLVPRDSKGRRCGLDTDVLNQPYLFFFDITKCFSPTTPFTGCPTSQVCVTRCPQAFYSNAIPDSVIDKGFCMDGDCPEWMLPSTALQKRCVPKLSEVTEQMIKEINKFEQTSMSILQTSVSNIKLLSATEEVGQTIVEDLAHSWWKIAIGVCLALVGCILYIMLLRWLASPMVWLSIFGVVIGLGAALYFTIKVYIDAKNNYDNFLKDPSIYEEYLNKNLKTKRDLWLAGVIILSIVLVIIVLVLIVLRKRIILAIALIKEGSKAVSSVTASLFFPILPWLLQIGVIAYAIICGIYLATAGKPVYKTRTGNLNCDLQNDVICDPATWVNNSTQTQNCNNATCKFIKIDNNDLYPYLQAYNVIGFFWGHFFVIALGQMVLASIFAQWYWTFKKSQVPFFAVTSAFLRTLRYHIGTLAFGSLVIAICRIIRMLLEYIDHKLKKYDNEITRAIMCIFKCFFYCLEKFLRFLNKNAYIMCAVHGKNFCVSAKDAFMLLMRNILRVWVLDKVTDFVFFLSKVLLTLGVGAVSYVFFVSELLPTTVIDNSTLNYGIVPVVVIMICTFLISSLFFSVYTMAVDTLFLCFLEDCERNDGSPEKPYYMSKNLMKIFGKKNKID